MDAVTGLLKATLTPEEYNGYLKASVVINALAVGHGKNTDCAVAAMQHLEELVSPIGGGEPKDLAERKPQAYAKSGAQNSRKPAIQPKNYAAKKPSVNKAGIRADIDADMIREMYITQNLPAKECCKQLNISLSTFGRVLAYNGIKKQQHHKSRNKDSSDKGAHGGNNSYNSCGSYNSFDDDAVDRAARAAARDILNG